VPAPTVIEQVVARWHAFVRGEEPSALHALLDEDVVFYSPIVFTPQRGKQITSLYLQAAAQTFSGGGAFRYTKTALSDDTAFLEFETTMQGKYVNGIDIIRCNDAGRIIEFRVMIRPLQAVNLVHQQMAAMLESMAPPE
jgi:ketosteroid isomerase-like protein